MRKTKWKKKATISLSKDIPRPFSLDAGGKKTDMLVIIIII